MPCCEAVSPSSEPAADGNGLAGLGALAEFAALSSAQTVDWHGPDQAIPSVELALLQSMLRPAVGADEIGRLGSYRILRLLGLGGMGAVFHAEDILLKRSAALKIMLPRAAQRLNNRERFLREARSAAAVTHPRIVTIYQIAEDGGTLYLAMEFLEGETLASRLVREKPLPLAEVLRIGRETAEGLAAAHQRGLIHRDIKPGNLWLEQHRQQVKILDFGLARALREDAEITQPGMMIGTPSYMAPEQARGGTVDYRCDLYSLGAMLYVMASGHLPFRGSNTMEVLSALLLEQQRPLREHRPDAPGVLEDLTNRLLAKEPNHRPSSAAEVVEILGRLEIDLFGPSTAFGSTLSGVRAAPEPSIFGDLDPEVETIPLQETDPNRTVVNSDDTEIVEADLEEFNIPTLPLERLHQLTGEVLGHFHLGVLLGRGQHGVVFQARDLRTQAVVALKVLAADFPSNAQETTQFMEAIKSGFALRHPHLVGLLAAGRNEPYCWIAEEYIAGDSLIHYLNRLGTAQASDWRFALRVAIHIARALDSTSQRRLVHRNVTPANILVDQDRQIIKLNDLVLARALRGSGLAHRVLDRKTLSELVYLAPEQVDGESSYVDFLCDLYSLGAIVYHLSTGYPIFHADSLAEGLPLVLEHVPRQPCKYDRTIPRTFDKAIRRLLAKNQVDRYQRASELLAELEPVARACGLVV